jgi:hypothetical protein
MVKVRATKKEPNRKLNALRYFMGQGFEKAPHKHEDNLLLSLLQDFSSQKYKFSQMSSKTFRLLAWSLASEPSKTMELLWLAKNFEKYNTPF